ncbi:MAG: diguanylate cyclase, partial [Firmicutes bacterium]|nr:diguanylate cyclase [Bacillota bacterium]
MKPDINKHTGGIDRSNEEIIFSSLQTLMDELPGMIFVKDRNLVYRAGTKSFAEMTGKKSMDEVLGRTDPEIFEDKELAGRFVADDRKLLAGGQNLIDYVEPITDENGQARYSNTSKYILRNSKEEAIGLLGISRDITKKMKRFRQYEQEVNYLFNLPEDAYAALFIDIDSWRIIGQRRQSINGNLSPLYDTMESFLATMRAGLDSKTSPAAKEFYESFSAQTLSYIYNSGRTAMEMEYIRALPNGMKYWVRDEFKFLTNPEDGHLDIMLLVRDIDAKKRAQSEFAQLSASDTLTGLLNRRAGMGFIEIYLNGEGEQGSHALLMIDVDNFRVINDLFGTEEGDRVLVNVAERIKNCFQKEDIFVRLSGDKFVVLAKNIPSRMAVQKRAERLLSMVQDIRAAKTASAISASIGISEYPEDGKNLDELYSKAEKALSGAKKQGKSRLVFASDEQKLPGEAVEMRYEDYNSLILDNSGSVCYISDIDTYELIHVNKDGMDMLGFKSPEEYKGKKCYNIIQGLDAPCPFCSNNKLIEGIDYRWEHYNGKLNKWFDNKDTLLHINGRLCHLEIAKDISVRREKSPESCSRLTMEDVLFRCLTNLTSNAETNKAVDLFLKDIGSYYQADRVYIMEFDPD